MVSKYKSHFVQREFHIGSLVEKAIMQTAYILTIPILLWYSKAILAVHYHSVQALHTCIYLDNDAMQIFIVLGK